MIFDQLIVFPSIDVVPGSPSHGVQCDLVT